MMHFLSDHISNTQPNAGDAMAFGIGVAAFAQYLPAASALLSMVWVGLRIYITIRDEILRRKQEKTDGNE